MKKLLIVVLMAMTFLLGACGTEEQPMTEIKPQVSQMKTICELATMDCYFHNVAKFEEKDAEKVLLWTKDKRFWSEYSGVVTIGIDVSLLNIEVVDYVVTITIPPAEVLGCRVDETTLSEESFIIDKDSANINADDQTEAFRQAQILMEKAAVEDTILLAGAQQRAQRLLEDYINNIGETVGVNYTIKWVYVDAGENKI